MRLSKSLDVASKDFEVYRRKKNIVYSTLVLPFMVSVLLPFVIRYVIERNASLPAGVVLPPLLASFSFFYMVLSGIVPATIAAYSIVGEKVEKSFEPLLATPMTDAEILVGKGIAAFVPSFVVILIATTVFMTLMNVVTAPVLGYAFYPNLGAAVVFYLMVPLAMVMSVEWNVIVSSRVSDVRIATQVGVLLILPFAGVYVGGELGIIPLDDIATLLTIAGVLALLDIVLLYVAKKTFQREEILTRWK